MVRNINDIMMHEQRGRLNRMEESKDNHRANGRHVSKHKHLRVDNLVNYYLSRPEKLSSAIGVSHSHDKSCVIDMDSFLDGSSNLCMLQDGLDDILASESFEISDDEAKDLAVAQAGASSTIEKQSGSQTVRRNAKESLQRIDDSIQKLLQQSRENIQRQLSEARSVRSAFQAKLSSSDDSMGQVDANEELNALEYLSNVTIPTPTKLSGVHLKFQEDQELSNELIPVSLLDEAPTIDLESKRSDTDDDIGDNPFIKTSLRLESTSPNRIRLDSRSVHGSDISGNFGKSPMVTAPLSQLQTNSVGSPLGTFSPLQLLTQRHKLKSPQKFRVDDVQIIEESLSNEEDNLKERERLIDEITQLACDHRLLRSFNDVRVIPKDEAQGDDSQIEQHMQRLLHQHRQRNKDFDSNIQATLQMLTQAQALSSPSSSSNAFGFSTTLATDEGWGRCPSQDFVVKSSLLGRGKFGAVYAAQMKLKDTPLMQSVLQAHTTRQTAQQQQLSSEQPQQGSQSQLPAIRSPTQASSQTFLMSPTAALLSSVAKNNRNLFLPPILHMSALSARSPTNNRYSPGAAAEPAAGINQNETSPRSGLDSPRVSRRGNYYHQHFMYLKEMLENPFTPRQAALIPKAKTVALKIAQYAGTHKTPTTSSSSSGDVEYPPLACTLEFLREVKVSALIERC
jgi:hypothetical protein